MKTPTNKPANDASVHNLDCAAAATTVRVRTWKVRTTATGVVLTLNGQEFDLGPSAEAVVFDLSRAAGGWNPPEAERTIEHDGAEVAS